MKFYNIADEYINFLRTFDSKVSENKQESRLYNLLTVSPYSAILIL